MQAILRILREIVNEMVCEVVKTVQEDAMHARTAQLTIDPGPEQDFVLWAARQARLLRTGAFEQLDRPHLSEELEDLVRHTVNQLEGRLMVLIMHLLKCQYQPARKTRSWTVTLLTQRTKIA
jgi:hypothetical protein